MKQFTNQEIAEELVNMALKPKYDSVFCCYQNGEFGIRYKLLNSSSLKNYPDGIWVRCEYNVLYSNFGVIGSISITKDIAIKRFLSGLETGEIDYNI